LADGEPVISTHHCTRLPAVGAALVPALPLPTPKAPLHPHRASRYLHATHIRHIIYASHWILQIFLSMRART
jgi:hypothetical protein